MNVELLCRIVDKADKDFELATVPAETLKKFAELIVKECADVALWEQGKGYDVGAKIKEHFGL